MVALTLPKTPWTESPQAVLQALNVAPNHMTILGVREIVAT